MSERIKTGFVRGATIGPCGGASSCGALSYIVIVADNTACMVIVVFGSLMVESANGGDRYDNAANESWSHSVKPAAPHGERFLIRQGAKKQIFEYTKIYYN